MSFRTVPGDQEPLFDFGMIRFEKGGRLSVREDPSSLRRNSLGVSVGSPLPFEDHDAMLLGGRSRMVIRGTFVSRLGPSYRAIRGRTGGKGTDGRR